MKSIAVLAVAVIVLAGFGSASAADDPIVARQAIMKANGKATKLIVSMVKGEVPYDGASAVEALKSIETSIATFPGLFPKGSGAESGYQTDALARIWETPDDFKAKAEQLGKDVKLAEATASNGIDALKAALNTMGKDCGACHRDYRADRN